MRVLSFRVWTIGVMAALLLVVALSLTASASGGTWTLSSVTTPFNFTRFDGQNVNGTVYFLGGRDQSNNTDGTIWKLDLATKTFSMTGATMPVPISNYGIAMLTDSTGVGLYTFGGRNGSGGIVTDVQVYYPATNTVADITSDPWPGTTPSNCVSLPAMAVAFGKNKALVAGGASFLSAGCLDDNSAQSWVFDPMAAPGSKWTKSGDLSQARGYITMVVAKGKVLAIGGDQNIGGSLFAQTTVDIYTPSTGMWATGPALPEACDESQAFVYLAKVVLAGCGQWPSALADTWLFDGTTWTAGSPLNVARRNQAGFTTGKGIPVVAGGYDSTGGSVLNSIEYDPSPLVPGTWSPRHPVTAPAGGATLY